MKCPKCAEHGVETVCEPYAEVDIGVGVMQGAPWGCPACHWVEDDGGDPSLCCPDCGLMFCECSTSDASAEQKCS